jgi:hypothetical protein
VVGNERFGVGEYYYLRIHLLGIYIFQEKRGGITSGTLIGKIVLLVVGVACWYSEPVARG